MSDVEIVKVSCRDLKKGSDKTARPSSNLSIQENMCDYICGHLGEKEKREVEKYLDSSEKGRIDLKYLQEGLDYCSKMKKESQALNFSKRSLNFYNDLLQKKEKPSLFEHYKIPARAVPLGFVVFIGLYLSVLAVRHWNIDHKLKKSIGIHENKKEYIELSRIELAKEEASPEIKKEFLAFTNEMENVEKKEDVEKVEKTVVEKNLPTKDKKEVKSVEAKTTLARKPLAKLEGKLYRAHISLKNIEQATAEIVSKIKSLGGKKSGKVELGWRKSKGSYFHFSLPQKNEIELLSFLEEKAELKVSENEHRRLMPDGIVRYILWVEDLDSRK